MTLRPFIALFTAVILSVTWGSAVSAEGLGRAPFKDMIVFGDSLSDSAGNLFALSNDVEPPSPPYDNGRFSDGPLWVETLAGFLGLTLDAGNNRAVGGAFTGTENVNELDFPASANTGILSQIAKFEDDGGRIHPNALIVVWGAANNYIFDLAFADPAQVVNELEQAVEELANLGGRRFLVPNQAALGDIPLGNPLFAILSAEEKAFLNFRVLQHNAELAEVMAELSEDLGVRIVVLDVHTFFADLLINPPAFGFVNATIPCLVQLPDLTRIPTGVCPPDGDTFDATGTAFWDLVHPTTALHARLGLIAHMAIVGP